MVLFTVWIVTIVLWYPAFVSSQGCVYPKYAHSPIHVNSWLLGIQVSVKIDAAFTNDQKVGLESGTQQWNNLALACSGVRFHDFDYVSMQSYIENPPKGQLWWQRDDPENGFNGGVFAVIGFGGWVESARIKIHPNTPNVAQGTYYHYLGTHEVGHTFNLLDCISGTGCNGTEPTIMRGHSDGITSSNTFNTSGPKDCDLNKVQNIIATPLHQAQPRLQRQTGHGLTLPLPQILKPARTEAGFGILRIARVIQTRRSRLAAVPAAPLTTYPWTVAAVIVPTTIARFPMVVLRTPLTVGEAVAVFPHRF